MIIVQSLFYLLHFILITLFNFYVLLMHHFILLMHHLILLLSNTDW